MAERVLQSSAVNGGESTQAKLVFAYYVTGHGFGHATRVVEVARHLCAAGHEVHIVTGASNLFSSETFHPQIFIFVKFCWIVELCSRMSYG